MSYLDFFFSRYLLQTEQRRSTTYGWYCSRIHSLQTCCCQTTLKLLDLVYDCVNSASHVCAKDSTFSTLVPLSAHVGKGYARHFFQLISSTAPFFHHIYTSMHRHTFVAWQVCLTTLASASGASYDNRAAYLLIPPEVMSTVSAWGPQRPTPPDSRVSDCSLETDCNPPWCL